MESVEEICDHIALINKSKTILEGPINKIKAEFQDENYEVVIDSNQLRNSEIFDVLSQNKNKFEIKINSKNELKEVIDFINQNHNIISFKNLASIEDIFIKTVGK